MLKGIFAPLVFLLARKRPTRLKRMSAEDVDSVPDASAGVDGARDADAMSCCDTSVESSTVSPASSAAVKVVSASPASNYPVVWDDKPTNWVPLVWLDCEDKHNLTTESLTKVTVRSKARMSSEEKGSAAGEHCGRAPA